MLEENIDGITFVISIFQVVLLFRLTTREMVIVFDNLFCIWMFCKNNSSWQGLWMLCDSECKRVLLCSHNEQTSLLHVVGLLAQSVHLLTFRGLLEAFLLHYDTNMSTRPVGSVDSFSIFSIKSWQIFWGRIQTQRRSKCS